MLKILFILLALCTVVSSSCQMNRSPFEHVPIVTESERISDIRDIIQDERGYIWVGTDRGLLKLHGTNQTFYQNTPNDEKSLPDNRVNVILEQSDNIIWLGTDIGVYKYVHDCDCFSDPGAEFQGLKDKVTDLKIDAEGNIWIAYENIGLYEFNIHEGRLEKHLNEPDHKINLNSDILNQICFDDQYLWIGTGNAYTGSGLVRYNYLDHTAFRYKVSAVNDGDLIDNRISSFLLDDKNRFLVGTYNCGLHLYQPIENRLKVLPNTKNKLAGIYAPHSDKRIPISGLVHNIPHVGLLLQDSKDGYWVGTPGIGLYYFSDEYSNPIKFFFDHEGEENSSNNFFKCIYEDKQGVLWIGCDGGDLYKKDIYAPNIKYYPGTHKSELVYESPFQKGQLWAGSEGGGLRRINLLTKEVKTYKNDPADPASIRHNSVRNVYQESPTILWVGVGTIGGMDGGEDGLGGIDRLDIETGKFQHFNISPNPSRDSFSHTVYNILEDESGLLWLATGSGGLYRSNAEKNQFEPFPILLNNRILDDIVTYDVGFTPNGKIWTGIVSNNDPKELTVTYNESTGRFNTFIEEEATNLIEDIDGNLWISTWSNGVFKYDQIQGSWRQFTVEEGLPSNYSTFLVNGNDDNIWIGTRYGICRLDLQTNKIVPVNLDESWFYFGATALSDGQIFFSTKNRGLLSFYPEEITGNPFPPKINISKLIVSGEEYLKLNQDISIGYAQNDIKIEFEGLHFSEPESNTFAYRLHPLNDDWIEIGNERKIQFQSLSPGNYSFDVRSSNADGVWNTDQASLKFSIQTPFWKSTFGILLFSMIFLVGIFIFYQFQLSRSLAIAENVRLKELNATKAALYTNITHEFRTPLTVIQGLTKSVLDVAREKKLESLEEKLEVVQRNGTVLLNLVNEMLDLARLEAGFMEVNLVQTDIIAQINYVLESFTSLADSQGISMIFYSELDELYMDFDPDIITKILSNLISNSIKFTESGGKLIVHISEDKSDGNYDRMLIKVKDSGIGMEKNELDRIFDRFYQGQDDTRINKSGTGIGLTLTRQLVELCEGTIHVSSTPGKGSVFTVALPIERNAPLKNEITKVDGKVVLKVSESSLLKSDRDEDENKPLVLVIEDNEDVAWYLQLILENSYRVHHAVNGSQGVEAAISSVPDLIVSDVMMPQMNGFEVCEKLKSNELTDHIPILLLTAKVTTSDRLTGFTKGADAYLQKPFLEIELLTRLDQLLKQRDRMLKKVELASLNLAQSGTSINISSKFISRVVDILNNYANDPDFGSAQLASRLHLSDSQVYRKIKASTGKSTAVFIRSHRLQKARSLILHDDKSISEIAFEVGFKEHSWFSRAFKDEFGYSPSQLRGVEDTD